MERLLPHNVEAEAGVLGSIIIDPDAVALVTEFLAADDFYRDAHRSIYETVIRLSDQHISADFVTVCDSLEQQGKLEDVGGPSYVTSLINQVPTSGNVVYYGQIVLRTALLRRLIHAGGQIAAEAYADSEQNAAHTLESAEQLIFSISQRFGNATISESHVRDLLATYLTRLDQMAGQRGGITGVPTGFVDLDRLTGGLQRSDLIVMAGRPGMGKCLVGNTLIDDPMTGERVTIEEYVRRQIPMAYGLSENGKVRTTAISHWIDSGVKPCYRVRTRLGRVVEVTGHHPFLTVEGWKPLHALTLEDYIGVPTKVECFGTDETMPLGLVRLMAYYIAEGGLTRNTPKFSNADPLIVEDFKRIITNKFPLCAIRQYGIDYEVVQSAVVGKSKNPVHTWLTELGLMGKLAKEKSFPLCVWTWNKHYLAEFIRAIMSCDGCVYSSKGVPIIEFTVASELLASDMQHAFTRFGIVSKLCKKNSSYNGKYFDAWRVEITSPENVQRYQQEIGWFGEKVMRFAGYKHVLTPRGGNNGHAPKEVWSLIRKECKDRKNPPIELARQSGQTTLTGHANGFNSHTNRGISHNRLASFANVPENVNLQRVSSPDVYWDKIVSIESIGDHKVYDLTIPDGSNFIAQDVFVHNSSLALSIAHAAAKHHQRKIGIFSLEMSKDQLIQRLLAVESGVNQQRLRTGWIEDHEWELILAAIGPINAMDIWIDDTASISTIQLRSKARRWALEHGIDLIIVDYLQLMQSSLSEGQRQKNREQEVSDIAKALKGLARELNIPVLALAQLSRAVESRASKVPQLSDLRESGAIENDSDIVMFIYRDDVYNPDSERPNTADIIVAKHRNGPAGEVCVAFDKSQTRFRDIAIGPPGLERAGQREDDIDIE